MSKTSSIATIGHNQPQAKVVAALNQVLANTYMLGIKTHGYHWNVTGPEFLQLHEMFEAQYKALYDAADEIAERIRALDARPLSSVADFLKQSHVEDSKGKAIPAREMIADLLASHQKVSADLTSAIKVTEAAGDSGSNDLAVVRKREHDKAIWMLGALLED